MKLLALTVVAAILLFAVLFFIFPDEYLAIYTRFSQPDVDAKIKRMGQQSAQDHRGQPITTEQSMQYASASAASARVDAAELESINNLPGPERMRRRLARTPFPNEKFRLELFASCAPDEKKGCAEEIFRSVCPLKYLESHRDLLDPFTLTELRRLAQSTTAKDCAGLGRAGHGLPATVSIHFERSIALEIPEPYLALPQRTTVYLYRREAGHWQMTWEAGFDESGDAKTKTEEHIGLECGIRRSIRAGSQSAANSLVAFRWHGCAGIGEAERAVLRRMVNAAVVEE